jgi:hypothetical protein
MKISVQKWIKLTPGSHMATTHMDSAATRHAIPTRPLLLRPMRWRSTGNVSDPRTPKMADTATRPPRTDLKAGMQYLIFNFVRPTAVVVILTVYF